MTYKISYLSNGNKIKITNTLFYQLKSWDMEGVLLQDKFIDELKSQDNEWINSNRNYYRHNAWVDQQSSSECLITTNAYRNNPIAAHILTQEKLHQIYKILLLCSGRQRRRFIMHFYYGYSYSEIAVQEGVSKNTVRQSILRARKIIRDMNIL